MSTIYYHEPFFSLNDFYRLFDDALGRQSSDERSVQRQSSSGKNQFTHGFMPSMDIHESPESNLVTATIELPGLKKEDVSIDVRNGRLVVSGEANTSKEFAENGYVHRERHGQVLAYSPVTNWYKAG